MIKKPSLKFLYIFLIFALSIYITIVNLGWKRNFIGDDSGVRYLYPETMVNLSFFTWNNYISPGVSNTIGTTKLLWGSFILLLSKIGLSSILIERIVYFMFFFTSGTGFFFLARKLSERKIVSLKHLELASFIGSLLYMFNSYTMVLTSFPLTTYHFSYALLPILLFLVIKNFKEKAGFGSLFMLAIVALLYSGGNPSNTVSAIAFLIVFGLFHYHKEFMANRVSIFYFLLLFLALSSYIYLPVLANKGNPYGSLALSNNLASLDFNSSNTTFLNLFRLLGFHSWKSFPYSQMMTSNPLFVFSTFLISLSALFALLIEKDLKKKIFFGGTLVFFLYLAKGSQAPFNELFLFVFKKFPPLQMYRAVYYKFLIYPLFIFCLLLSFLVVKLFSAKKPKIGYKYALILILIVSISLNAVPFFYGAVPRKFHLSKIPEEYDRAEMFFGNDPTDFKIFSAPSLSTGLALKWGEDNYYGGATHPDMFILNKPVLNSFWFNKKLQGKTASWENFEEIFGFLGLFDIKYIFWHKDALIKYNFDGGLKSGASRISDFQYLYNYLLIDNNFAMVKDNQFFSVFQLASFQLLPHFYIPQNIVYSPNGVEALSDILSFDDHELRSAIYFGNINGLKERADQVVVLGKLKSPVSDLVNVEGKGDLKVAYPYVKHKPGNWKWQLALLKERYDESKTAKEKNQGEILKKNLFYASKRISELSLFYPFASNYIYDVWQENYENNLANILKVLEVFKNEDKIKFNALLKEARETIIDHESKVLEMNLDGSFGKKLLEHLGKISFDLDHLEDVFDLNNIVYQVDIPIAGSYEIYAKGEAWVKIGDRELVRGEQSFSLPLEGVGENLLDEDLRIMDYSSDDFFKISFDYKSREETPRVKLIEEGEGEIFNRKLPRTGDEFRKTEMFFKSSLLGKKGRLIINADQFDNLEARKIYQPELILKKLTEKSNEEESIPQVTFVKINPTKYKIKIEGAKAPYDLVFSESFHQSWKLYVNELTDSRVDKLKSYDETVASYFDGEIKEGNHRINFLEPATFETWGKKSIADDRHYLVNGYANSWHIKPSDVNGKENYELIVEFWPQKLFYVGLTISLATLFGCLGYLGVSIIGSKFKVDKKKVVEYHC